MSAFVTYLWWCTSLVNVCIDCTYNAVLNVYLHNRKEQVTQQTKYNNNVTKTLESGRKSNTNRQIETHERGFVRDEAYYHSC